MENTATLTDLAYCCWVWAYGAGLCDTNIFWCPQEDLALALEGLTEDNLYATAEAIACLLDWSN